VPSKAELNVLFNNRAAICGFDDSGSDPAGWYRSSTEYLNHGEWVERFSDGRQYYLKFSVASLRCVR
jgi:hypothetical protein